MRLRVSALVSLALLLSACGDTSSGAGDAFNDSFSKNFRESCVASASQAGVPAEAAETLCECTIDEVNEKYSTVEKLGLSKEDVQAVMSKCIEKVVPQ